MFLLISLSVLGGILTVVAVITAEKKVSVPYLIFSLMILEFVIFSLGPRVLGYGHVPNVAEEYTERLEIGVAYEPLASYEDGESEILLVKKEGGMEVLAIRVTGPIPLKRFTLIDGKPSTLK